MFSDGFESINFFPIMDKQVSDTSDWTKLTDLSFGGVTLRNARLAPNINPNSKLCGFISILINPTPKRRFFDQTFMCHCLLVDYSPNVCVFLGAKFGGCPPEFRRLRLATVSGSTEIKITRSKNFFRHSDTCTELHFFRRI